MELQARNYRFKANQTTDVPLHKVQQFCQWHFVK
jgi:hypothetical protein